MASIQIEVVLDSSGVVQNVSKIEQSLDQVGPRGKQAFDQLDKSQQNAMASTRLLNRYLGLDLPRALQNVIAKSTIIAPILNNIFPMVVAGAFISQISTLAETVMGAATEYVGLTDAVKKWGEENLKANASARTSFATMDEGYRQISLTIADMAKQQKAIDSYTFGKGAASGGGWWNLLTLAIPGGGDLIAAYRGEVSALDARKEAIDQNVKSNQVLIDQLMKLAEIETKHQLALNQEAQQAVAAGLQGANKAAYEHQSALLNLKVLSTTDPRLGGISQEEYNNRVAIENTKFLGGEILRTQQWADETIKLQNEVALGYLTGADKILEKERQTDQEIGLKVQRSLLDFKDGEAQKVAAHELAQQQILAETQKRTEEETQIIKSFTDEVIALTDRQAAQSATGTDKIIADARRASDALQAKFNADSAKIFGLERPNALGGAAGPLSAEQMNQVGAGPIANLVAQFSKGLATIEQTADAERRKMLGDAAIDTVAMQNQAAIASAAPWERANLEIYLSAQDRVSHERQLLQNREITVQDFAARERAIWQQANARIVDDWTAAFENIFSGGIAHMIESLAKQQAARLAAQFMFSSGLSQVVGPWLGLPGGAGAAGGATGMMGGLGALGSIFGGGNSTAGYGLGGWPGTPGFNPSAGMPSIGGVGSWTGAGYTPVGGGYGVPGIGGYLSSNSSGAGLLGQISYGNMLSVMPAKSGLAGLLPGLKGIAANPLFAAMLGGKVGGTTGMIGATLLGVIGSGLLTGNPAMLQMMSSPLLAMGMTGPMAAGLLAGAGGGLLGWGIGSQYGKTAGILGGAGSGALMGLAFGGPIGALIGGIIGFFGGLFGGLFGGGKRKKQAEQFAAQQQIEIQKVVDSFKSFQLDYASAKAQLEAMRSSSSDQLGQLKGEGKSVFKNTVSPAIDTAEKQIEGWQNERERRMGLIFGPPEFAVGGWTGASGGIVHPREFVVREGPAAENRSLLEDLNRGGNRGSGGNATYNIYTIDGPTTVQWLKQRGGYKAIQDVARQYAREGR